MKNIIVESTNKRIRKLQQNYNREGNANETYFTEYRALIKIFKFSLPLTIWRMSALESRNLC